MRRGLLTVMALVTVAATSPAAHAYPELAVQVGARRCNSCHLSPAGGGLLNEYGRDVAADELSAGGDGAFLHGAWTPPAWLALGGDLRAAALANDNGGSFGTELAAFPMQLDLRLRARRDAFSLVVTAGLRGSARRYERAAVTNYVVSAEHYLLWQPRSQGPYVRAGRFFPVMGLRLPDHTLYIRRYTGLNLFEETYALGAGYVKDSWEAHASAFVQDPILAVGRDEAGVAIYAERHGAAWAVGASGRIGVGDEATRALGGLVGRVDVPAARLGILGEIDVTRDMIDGVTGDVARTQLVSYLGVDVRARRGLRVAGWWEHFHEAVGVPGLARESFGASLRWFPRAHWETILHARWQLIGADEDARLLMLQIHYYL